ncbi:MAG: peptidoglycan-binding protein [Proteobacteria bacterium]|nr:peptidoglycan-binding protein [Pseudomonadota bacterium]MBU4296511.1 peptidoglycan-binding protein [Pseudomonadota bacterium]MCG2746892.1 peptidoglycan-binding protein [Desulfobulbaceae bacterium]
MALFYPAFATSKRIQKAAMNAPPIRIGERGPAVAILQAALVDLGYKMPRSTRKTGMTDGVFGEETKNTVYRFQVDKHLKDKDGAAGKDTLAKLDELLKGTAMLPPATPPVPPLPSTRDYAIGKVEPVVKPDSGAGVWNSRPKTAAAMVQKHILQTEVLPKAVLVIGDDAVKHMYHYLGNTGKTLEIDLEGMIQEVPSAKKRFENEVNQAKRFVEMLPEGTYDIASKNAESAYNFKRENRNWFYAVGGYSTWGQGKVSVKKAPSGMEYKLEFEYRFYDRYNWDIGKKVEIIGITITDYFMGEFHRQGLAQEFNMTGLARRTFRWRHGQAIPPNQYLPEGSR